MVKNKNNQKSSLFSISLFFMGIVGVFIIILSSEIFPETYLSHIKKEFLIYLSQKGKASNSHPDSNKSVKINNNTNQNNETNSDNNSNDSFELYKLIKSDFKILRKTLNPQAFSVNEVIWNIYDQDLKLEKLSSSLDLEVSKNEKNQNYLEVDVFTNYDKQSATTVLQLSYFDKKTKNKIFEITRSYDHKKKPD